jgi:hypothetical protein
VRGGLADPSCVAGSSSNSSPDMTDSCYTDELMMRSTEGTYEEAS